MNEFEGKENSVLEIYVPPFAPKPCVRLQVNGANSCWLNLSPEHAFDTASAIWKAAAQAIMQAGGAKPVLDLNAEGNVRIVPGQPLNRGSVSPMTIEATARARPVLPPAKPRQRNKQIKSPTETSPGDQAPDKPA